MAVLVVISQDQARQVRNRKKRSRCKVISIVTFSSKFIYVFKRLVNKRSIQGCLNFYDKKGIVLFELLRTKKVCLGVTHIMILGSKKKNTHPPTFDNVISLKLLKLYKILPYQTKRTRLHHFSTSLQFC